MKIGRVMAPLVFISGLVLLAFGINENVTEHSILGGALGVGSLLYARLSMTKYYR